mgnify:CR=1 FL=1
MPKRIHSKIKSMNKNAKAKAERFTNIAKNKQNEKNPTNLKK